MTTLKKQQQQFTKDYTDEQLPAIFIDQGYEAEDELELPNCLSTFYLPDTIQLIKNARLTLLIAVNRLSQSSIIEALQGAADKGVRIYLLLGEKKINQEAINSLASRCLLRFVPPQQGGVIIADHATFLPSGYILSTTSLFTHNSGDENLENTFAVKLNKEQISDSYRSFCHLFWHVSQEELLKQGSKPKQASSSPSGDIILNHNYHLPNRAVENIKNTLSFSVGQINATLTSSPFSQIILSADKSIINLAIANNINEVIKNGKHVVLTELDIPNIVASHNECWIIPDTAQNEHINWCIKLEAQQASSLIQNVKETIDAAQWQLSTGSTVNELTSSIIFADDPATSYNCADKLDIELKAVYATSIDSFLNDTIETLTQNQTGFQRTKLAKKINYSVEKHPPYCPDSATPARLYSQWNKAQGSWLLALADLESKIRDSNNQRTGLATNIDALLKKFSLGQQIKHKKLIKKISSLREKDMVNSTHGERFESEKEYLELFTNISKDNEDTTFAIEKAKLEQQWNTLQTKLEKNLVDKEEILNSKEQNFTQLKNSHDKNHSSVFKQYEQSWKREFKSLPDNQQESLRAIELSSPTEAGNWLRRENKNKKFNAFRKVVENFLQQSKKVERDLAAKEKEYNDAKRAYEVAGDSLSQHGVKFVYSAACSPDELGKQLGNTSISKAKDIDWPKEELPIDDSLELMEDNNERYLLLSTLGVLETAKKEAFRLNAKLCAPANKKK